MHFGTVDAAEIHHTSHTTRDSVSLDPDKLKIHSCKYIPFKSLIKFKYVNHLGNTLIDSQKYLCKFKSNRNIIITNFAFFYFTFIFAFLGLSFYKTYPNPCNCF